MPENHHTQDFEETVLPHLDAAYNLARRLVRNEQDAKDMVQEAYLRALRYFASFHGSDARGWVLRIVRNTCYSWLNANRSLRHAVEFDENLFQADSRATNPEDLMLLNDDASLVRKAIEKLPPAFRKVVFLREIEGMSYKEIADSAGMPPGTVMSSLSRARSRLLAALTLSLQRGNA